MSASKPGAPPTRESLKELDKGGKRAGSAAPSVRSGGRSLMGGDNKSEKSKYSEPYDEMTVDQCDVRIFQVHNLVAKIQRKIDALERNTLLTGMRLKKEVQPL